MGRKETPWIYLLIMKPFREWREVRTRVKGNTLALEEIDIKIVG